MERKGQLICAACGAPREETPGVEVLAPAQTKGQAIAFRIIGYSMLAAALVFAGVSALVDQYLLSAILGAGFAIPGWLSLRRAKLAAQNKQVEFERAQVRKIRELMADQAGRVTAEQAARKLGVSVEQADALLTKTAKDGTFEVDFDEDGTVYYIDPAFSSRGARVRVEPSADELELEQEAATDARSKLH